MNTKDLLQAEIDRIIEEMGDMDITSAEYKTAAETVAKLIDRLDELDKSVSQWDVHTKEDARQAEELKLKREQLEHEKKVHEDDEAFKAKQIIEDRHKMIVNIVLTSLGIIVPTGLTVWGTYKTFKFEETGTITTAMGRGFIGRLFGKK
jgi:hypothetical protein